MVAQEGVDMGTRFELIGAGLILFATTFAAYPSGAPKPPAAPSKVIGCMSLVSPTMLFCSDSSNRGLMCDTSATPPDCKTMTALYRSWRGHPERRETFYRKLYGAEQ